jgi:cytochrome oxidase Cu insertion factor (SCO1/SenC/PrrC family)
MKRLTLLHGALALTLALSSAWVGAQGRPAAAAPITLNATTTEGNVFDTSRLKGKVVLVFYWSTQCAVCRSHLPELRANMAGWKGKPFELVTVNMDANPEEWRSYESIAAKTQSVRPIALWSGEKANFKLPVTVVIDSTGKEAMRLEGRIAPDAWNMVADLLP